MGILRSAFWCIVFVAFTFLFTVIFEHGFSDFSNNAKKELALFKKVYGSNPGPKPDGTDNLLK